MLRRMNYSERDWIGALVMIGLIVGGAAWLRLSNYPGDACSGLAGGDHEMCEIEWSR